MSEGRRRKSKGGDAQELLRRPAPRKDSVNRETWLRFLEVFIDTSDDRVRFNGCKISDNHVRALYRWRHEGSTPTIWTVDEFLVAYNMSMADYEIWCFTEGRKLWPGETPEWWDA